MKTYLLALVAVVGLLWYVLFLFLYGWVRGGEWFSLSHLIWIIMLVGSMIALWRIWKESNVEVVVHDTRGQDAGKVDITMPKSISHDQFHTIVFPVLFLCIIHFFSPFGPVLWFGDSLYYSGSEWLIWVIAHTLRRLVLWGTLYNILVCVALISPLMHMLSHQFPWWKSNKYFSRISNISSWFTVWYFIFAAIILTYTIFFDAFVWTPYLTTRRWIFTVPVLLFVISYPFVYYKKHLIRVRESGAKSSLSPTIMFLLVWGWAVLLWSLLFSSGLMFSWGISMPSLRSSIFFRIPTKLVQLSQKRMMEGWDTYESYEKAHFKFLDRAYQRRFNKSANTNDPMFSKLYDSSPEAYFGDKLKNISLRGANSRWTNASRVGENAMVALQLIEIDAALVDWVMESRYTLNMINLTGVNQEVIIDFQVPSTYSVVSDLKLWLNWELLWIVASRGAANKVYQDSLRVNTDPALLEKVWARSYKLRVFPILSKFDEKTQWRQRVQFTVYTPIQAGEQLSYSPKLSMINLKVEDETDLIAKIYKAWSLIKEDRVSDDQVEEYLQQNHIIPQDILSQVWTINLQNVCLPWVDSVAEVETWSENSSRLVIDRLPTTEFNLTLEDKLIIDTRVNEIIASQWRATSTKTPALSPYTIYNTGGSQIALIANSKAHLPSRFGSTKSPGTPYGLLCTRKKGRSLIIWAEALALEADTYIWWEFAITSMVPLTVNLASKAELDRECRKIWIDREYYTGITDKSVNGIVFAVGLTAWLGVDEYDSSSRIILRNRKTIEWWVAQVDFSDGQPAPAMTQAEKGLIRRQVTQEYIREKNQNMSQLNPLPTPPVAPSQRPTTITNEQITQHINDLAQANKSSKITVFLDNSASVKRNNIDKMYSAILSKIQNAWWKLQDVDIYTFNFAATKVASMDDVQFRWYSDIDAVVDTIEKGWITNQHIIIVTDDDSFSISMQEQKNRNIKNIATNSIDVLVFGDEVKTFKSDFNTLISAVWWDLYTINPDNVSELDAVLTTVVSDVNKKSFALCTGDNIGKPATNSGAINKITAWITSSILLWMMQDANSWMEVAKAQNALATQYNMVNQFNAMIALETDKQYEDLQRYERSENRFNADWANVNNVPVREMRDFVDTSEPMRSSNNRSFWNSLIDRLGDWSSNNNAAMIDISSSSFSSNQSRSGPSFDIIGWNDLSESRGAIRVDEPESNPIDISNLWSNAWNIILLAIVYFMQIYNVLSLFYFMHTWKENIRLKIAIKTE